MIGLLKGILLEKRAPSLLIDVGGIGYEVDAPMTAFYDLPEVGEVVQLHTHFIVRETAQLLFGFSRRGDRDMFRKLLQVKSVGPRVALNILSNMTREELVSCIHEKDVNRLQRLPGVGPKTAKQMMVDLPDKVGDEIENAAFDAADRLAGGVQPSEDALSALKALGYKPKEAIKAVSGVKPDGLCAEDIIKQALRALAG